MKVAGGRVAGFLKAPDPAVYAVLIYGRDRGLARERSKALATGFKLDPSDPFVGVDLTDEELKSDPARVGDELRALSFGGGGKLVRVVIPNEQRAGVLVDLMGELDADAFEPAGRLIIEAGDLPARSKLRKTFESARRGAAIACYIEGPQELANLLDAALKDAGRTIEPDARAALLPQLEGDHALARGEIDKLLIYKGDEPGDITLADVEAISVGAEIGDFDGVTSAVLDGDAGGADRAVRRATASGLVGVALCRALLRAVSQLEAAAILIADGQPVDAAIGAVRPPLFGPARAAAKRRLQSWDAPRLEIARSHILACETRLKQTGAPDAALIGRLVFALAQLARKGTRR